MKAMASKTAKRGPRRRPAPLGLQSIFQAMQPFDFQKVYGATSPGSFADVYKSIAKTSQGDDAFSAALTAAINADYPGGGFGPDGNLKASECADVAAHGGFWAGVAACWRYMTAINGGAR
jgi:hypothetical protein